MSLKHPTQLKEKVEEWWQDELKKRSVGEKLHQWPDGWSVQNLTSPESLEWEGDKMGHCVDGYHSNVEDGETIIHSLRDHNNEPHATMEIEPAMNNCRQCANGDDGHVYCDHDLALP